MLTVLYVWGRNSWASGAIQSGALGLYCFNDEVVDETDEGATLGAVVAQYRCRCQGSSTTLPGVRVLGLKGAALAAFGERPRVFAVA